MAYPQHLRILPIALCLVVAAWISFDIADSLIDAPGNDLDHVVVEVIDNSERVRVTIHWAGGFESHHEIRKSVQRFEQLEFASDIRAKIISMKQSGACHQAVADALNGEGFRSTTGTEFTLPIISSTVRDWSRFRKVFCVMMLAA